MVSLERAISGIRADDRHIGHAVAQPKASYALAELIDVSDDIIAEYERQTLGCGLRIHMPPDQSVCVVEA
jgi:hypothetical protein